MKIYIERRIESEKDLPSKEGTYFVHTTIGDKDIFNWTFPQRDNPVDEYWDMEFQKELWVNTFDYWLECIEVSDEGAEGMLNKLALKQPMKYESFPAFVENESSVDIYEAVIYAMKEFAAQQVAKDRAEHLLLEVKTQPTDKDIEQYLLKKYPPLFVDDNGNPFDVNKSFRESALIDIKAAMSGEIKKKEG